MTTLEQYQLVRIKQLLQPPTEYDGWRINKRPPGIGDIGTLIDILRTDGLPNRFVVESCKTNGTAVWLADFQREELEPYADDQRTTPEHAHLVFLRSGVVVLVKRPDVDWKVLQEVYPDFLISLGPWDGDEIASYFTNDYTEDDSKWPYSRQDINEFFASSGVELSTK